MQNKIQGLVEKIRTEKPLILNITNHVTMDFVANGLLSLGACPIMCEAEDELQDLLKIANALVINIGTLNQAFVTLCEKALEVANKYNKPIVFDPVGSGASYYRTDTALNFLESFKIDIIRANASEISSLINDTNTTKGVDSTIETAFAVEHGKTLSQRCNAVIAISGKLDAIIEDNKMELIDRGAFIMKQVTGAGCLLSAIVAAFCAVESNYFEAVKSAVIFYDICAEIAAKKSNGPGSFKVNFIDELANFHK